MLKKYETISSKLIFHNDYWDYYIDEYKINEKKSAKYYYVKSRGATFVIPLLNSKSFIMVKQFRYLNNKFSIEFPGGGVKPNLSFEENALCELAEETGWTSEDLHYVGEFNPYNGVTNEICKVYFTDNLKRDNIAKPDPTEELEVLFLSLDELREKIANNEIWDGMTLAAFSLFTNSIFFSKVI